MKYALLGYDLDGSLEHVAADAKRTLHGRHGELHEHASIGDSIRAYRTLPLPPLTARHHPAWFRVRHRHPGAKRGSGKRGERDIASALHPRQRRPDAVISEPRASH
jgi:hypothetical protein